VSRYSARIGLTPIMWSPSSTITSPAIWLIPNSTPRMLARQVRSSWPAATAPTPISTNTAENPTTKPKHAFITPARTPAPVAPPSCISSTEMPEISERYAGSSGRTHGESTESRPAANASSKSGLVGVTPRRIAVDPGDRQRDGLPRIASHARRGRGGRTGAGDESPAPARLEVLVGGRLVRGAGAGRGLLILRLGVGRI